MSIKRTLLGISLGGLLGLSGACQHPCQARPGECVYLALDVATAPQAGAPGLIQLQAPDAALELKVSSMNGQPLDELVEVGDKDPSAFFCPASSECAADCPGVFKIASLPRPVLSADHLSRSYTIPISMLSGLSLGPARLCVSAQGMLSKPVYVINQLLGPAGPEEKSLAFQDYTPLSFDFAKDRDGRTRAVILGEKDSQRGLMAGVYPGFTGYLLAGIGSIEGSPSSSSVSVGSNTFVIWGAMTPPPSSMPAYRISRCPLDGTSAMCTSPTSWIWKVSDAASPVAAVGDGPGHRFILSFPSGPQSLKAFASELTSGQPLSMQWETEGPAGPVLLAAAFLQRTTLRTASDLIAVAKGSGDPDSRDVRVFLMSADGKPVLSAAYSEKLRVAIKEALGSQPLSALAAGDLDRDGLADVVLLSSAAGPGQVSILFNQGNGAFRVAGKGLGSFLMKPSLESPLAGLMTIPEPLDVKVENVDDPSDPSKARPEIVILGKAPGPSAAQIQILRLAPAGAGR